MLLKAHHIIHKIVKSVNICSVQFDQIYLYVYARSLDFTDFNLLLDRVLPQLLQCVCNCTFVIWQHPINIIFFCACYLQHLIFIVLEAIIYPFTWLKIRNV